MFKNLRNDSASSVKDGTKAIVVAVAKPSRLDIFNGNLPVFDNTFDFTVDSLKNRVTLSNILYCDYGLALIDWNFGFEKPFREFQQLHGFRSVASGISVSIFEAVSTSGCKINVGEAFKWHGNKIQAVEDNYCMYALSTPNSVTTEKVAMVRAVEGYRSWKKAIRVCQQQCNAINIDATKRCQGKEKIRERFHSNSFNDSTNNRFI
jgi:ASC-1-like (ASCH) protein